MPGWFHQAAGADALILTIDPADLPLIDGRDAPPGGEWAKSIKEKAEQAGAQAVIEKRNIDALRRQAGT